MQKISKTEPKCLLCRSDLQNASSKLRRSLDSEMGEDVKNILEELLSRSGNDELMQEYNS